jgi:protein-disulfide isomerase
MLTHSGIISLALIVVLASCGGNPADIEELKKGQKEILDKLAALDKNVQQIKTAPPAAAPQRPQVDPNKVYNIPLANSPARGPDNAKVTIVEFSDYQCPFCGQAETLVKQVLETYPKDVRLVFKQFPLTSIHPNAMPASKAAIAAGRQGKFWEMHSLIFEPAAARSGSSRNLRSSVSTSRSSRRTWSRRTPGPDQS